MTKDDHVKYWIKTSKKDWKRAEVFLARKDYVFGLFCLHLSMEKVVKALWVKENKGNYPPRVHNLVSLLARTSLKPGEDQVAILEDLNTFHIEGRYPDYQFKLHRYATKTYAFRLLMQTKELKKWLLKSM